MFNFINEWYNWYLVRESISRPAKQYQPRQVTFRISDPAKVACRALPPRTRTSHRLALVNPDGRGQSSNIPDVLPKQPHSLSTALTLLNLYCHLFEQSREATALERILSDADGTRAPINVYSYEKGRLNWGGEGLPEAAAVKLIKPLTRKVLGSDFNTTAWNADCSICGF